MITSAVFYTLAPKSMSVDVTHSLCIVFLLRRDSICISPMQRHTTGVLVSLHLRGWTT
jgi:hypothetical protein